jgi:16S rRNA processing protein RimM
MVEQQVRIGKIVGCHGVRGDVKVRPTSEEAEWVSVITQLLLKNPKTGEEKLLMVEKARHQGPFVLIHFKGLDNRNFVEPLVGTTLYANISELPKPQEGEFWADDLIGLTVIDAQTSRIRGVVKDLLSSGGSEFLEIQLENSEQTVVIPFIEKFFPEVNLETRTISIDLLSDFLALTTEPVTADRLEQ